MEGRDSIDGIIRFLEESEKLKTVARTVDLSGPGDYHSQRKESSAEHSWHLAVMAMALKPHLNLTDAEELKLLRLLLVHDLPEVYAGDTPALAALVEGADGSKMPDPERKADQKKREADAAERIFGLAADTDMMQEWKEFEARETRVARLAKALDKIHPLVQNRVSEGKDYQAFGSTRKVEEDLLEPHLARVDESAPILRDLAGRLLKDADESGWLGHASPTASTAQP